MAASGLDPAGSGPLLAAVNWIEQLLTGPLAIATAILAVAFVGFRMLSGDTSIRQGVRVIVGCFILFGAPMIARELTGAIQGGDAMVAPSGQPQYQAVPPPPPAPQVPTARNGNPFDPYASNPQ
ncbi:MAG TPA: TrbC/VirB2 family protein [Novosphingobium sp.]|nr:TrbC/VirB2 family protein [Novosphingobium sp.]